MSKGLVVILLCLQFLNLQAQDEVVLSASSKEVAVGERFEIVLSAPFRGQGTVDLKGAFTSLSEMHGSRTSNINGRVSAEWNLTLLVVANKPGTFTLPPATWVSGTKVYKSNGLTIRVIKGNGTQQAPPPASINPFEEFFTQPQIPQPIQPESFGQLITSKKVLYQGEPLVLLGKAYIEGRISDIADYVPTKIDFLHHIKHLINPNDGVQPLAEVLNNKAYSVVRLFEDIIVPQESGTFSIPAFEISMGFPSGFFGSSYVRVKSNALKIEVKPLPENAPESFQGAVGQYKLKVSHTAKSKLKTGDVFTIRAELSGKGNLHLVKPLILELPDGLKSYGDVTIDDQVLMNTNGVSGSVFYEYTIQVQKAGTYEFSPLSFTHFDTDLEKYVEAELPKIKFEARGENFSTDVLAVQNEQGKGQGKSTIWIWIVALILAIGSLYFLRKFVLKNSKNIAQTKRTTKVDARGNAINRLNELDVNSSSFISELEQITLNFFKESTQDAHFLISEETIKGHLENLGVSENQIDLWQQFWRDIQSLKYANFGQISNHSLKERFKDLVENSASL